MGHLFLVSFLLVLFFSSGDNNLCFSFFAIFAIFAIHHVFYLKPIGYRASF